MLSDEQIIRYNRWWTQPDWPRDDPHLRRLARQPTQLPAPQVADVDLVRPAVHILRGPRQVGKSTDLKLIAQRAFSEGYRPRQVVYLALDLLEGQTPAELNRTVERAYALASAVERPRLLLLDEVTSASEWRTTVKVLWDEGLIDDDIVVCTGSSAIDLARDAAERLPGRRGAGHDYLVLPQDFGSFAGATESGIPPGLGLTIGEILGPDGQDALLDARLHLPAMQRALERYLLFGGLPAAVAEAIAGEPAPTEDVRRVLWDSLVKEIQRRGATVAAAQALLERVMRSLGSRVSWNQLAQDMDVPLGGRARRRSRTGKVNDYRTVQSYVEFMAINYFTLVVYFWRPDSGTANVSKGKKIYFGDPLLQTITADRVGLARDPHAQVENAIALALYRRYERSERHAENVAAPERLHVWGTKSGGEIDFVCGARHEIEVVEVANWERVNRQKATAPMRALPGRPAITATRQDLHFGATASLVPAALLLWALSG
jgi:predicted AAA+ superfamily ATPase